jgi:hypothetical protein
MQRPTPTHEETRPEAEAAQRTQAEPTAPPAASPIPGEAALTGTPLTRQIEAMGAAAPATPPRTVRRRSVLLEPGYRAVELVWLLLTVAEAFVGLRVLFTALNARPDAGFVRFVDTVAGALVAPFHPIVSDTHLRGGGVLEIGSLIAMAVFLAAALAVVRLVRILTTPRLPAEPASF